MQSQAGVVGHQVATAFEILHQPTPHLSRTPQPVRHRLMREPLRDQPRAVRMRQREFVQQHHEPAIHVVQRELLRTQRRSPRAPDHLGEQVERELGVLGNVAQQRLLGHDGTGADFDRLHTGRAWAAVQAHLAEVLADAVDVVGDLAPAFAAGKRAQPAEKDADGVAVLPLFDEPVALAVTFDLAALREQARGVGEHGEGVGRIVRCRHSGDAVARRWAQRVARSWRARTARSGPAAGWPASLRRRADCPWHLRRPPPATRPSEAARPRPAAPARECSGRRS